ncbi:MAG: homoaconitate hydratase [Thermoplasmata archaeon]
MGPVLRGVSGSAGTGAAVSHFNFMTKRNLPPKITIYDTTLRDGEQMVGIAFSERQKLGIARRLDQLGVPQLDVGFPAVSREDMMAVRKIARAGLDAEILCLSRLRKEDIDAVQEAEADAALLFIAASPLHLRYKLKITEEDVLHRIPEALDHARSLGIKASFTPEDATRTSLPFLKKMIKTALEAGAWRVGIADTLGCATPEAIRFLVQRLRPLARTPFTLHLHNDFGLALANALAGLEAGADTVATTVCGFGERCGNVPLEQLAAALRFLYGRDTGIRMEGLTPLCRYVARIAGVRIPRNAPIVGNGVFTHKAGIHIAGVLACPATYEPYPPDAVGNRRKIVLGRHSGRSAVGVILRSRGERPDPASLERALRRVKKRKKERIIII